jgi:hypothetical protein
MPSKAAVRREGISEIAARRGRRLKSPRAGEGVPKSSCAGAGILKSPRAGEVRVPRRRTRHLPEHATSLGARGLPYSVAARAATHGGHHVARTTRRSTEDAAAAAKYVTLPGARSTRPPTLLRRSRPFLEYAATPGGGGRWKTRQRLQYAASGDLDRSTRPRSEHVASLWSKRAPILGRGSRSIARRTQCRSEYAVTSRGRGRRSKIRGLPENTTSSGVRGIARSARPCRPRPEHVRAPPRSARDNARRVHPKSPCAGKAFLKSPRAGEGV